MENLVELKKEEMREVEGGIIWAPILISLGATEDFASGVAKGFTKGVGDMTGWVF